MTRVLHAPRELVWKAWSEPALVRRWWGPDKFECRIASIEFREGGTSLVSMASRELSFPEQYSTWLYTKIVPMERIEFIHNLADKDGNRISPSSIGMPADFPQDVRHIVTFEDAGNGGTRITVTERDWPEGEMMKLSRRGLEECLIKMGDVVESL